MKIKYDCLYYLNCIYLNILVILLHTRYGFHSLVAFIFYSLLMTVTLRSANIPYREVLTIAAGVPTCADIPNIRSIYTSDPTPY